jgi:hypothetical protein
MRMWAASSAPVRSMQDRFSTALSVGYMSAKHMVHLKETYGLPLEYYADRVRREFGSGLKIDYAGLRHELLMLGISPSGVMASLAELQSAEKDWKLQTSSTEKV